LLKQLDKFLTQLRTLLVERYGEVKAATMHRETLDEYERLIPDLPYIGRGNLFTGNLVQSAWALALYRVIRRHGGAVEEASEVIRMLGDGEPLEAWPPKFIEKHCGDSVE
jgi:hypothetical protein